MANGTFRNLRREELLERAVSLLPKPPIRKHWVTLPFNGELSRAEQHLLNNLKGGDNEFGYSWVDAGSVEQAESEGRKVVKSKRHHAHDPNKR